MNIRSVYDLENRLKGETLFVIGTGPSGEDFPIESLDKSYTVALNDAIDLLKPTWWLLTTSLYLNAYADTIRSGDAGTLVVKKQSLRHAAKSVTDDIFMFGYRGANVAQEDDKKEHEHERLSWWDKDRDYLPGKNTVATVALSFACLLNADRVVLVGVDYGFRKIRSGVYQLYNQNLIRRRDHVFRKDPGGHPKKFKACIRYTWLRIRNGLWPIEIVTTSEALHRKLSGAVRFMTEEKVLEYVK